MKVQKLQQSQRGTALLEVEAAKEEYYSEVMRLRNKLTLVPDEHECSHNVESTTFNKRMIALLRGSRDINLVLDVEMQPNISGNQLAPHKCSLESTSKSMCTEPVSGIRIEPPPLHMEDLGPDINNQDSGQALNKARLDKKNGIPNRCGARPLGQLYEEARGISSVSLKFIDTSKHC